MTRSLSNELGYLRTYSYDSVGNTTTLTSFSGEDTVSRFDKLNRLIERYYSVDGKRASWSYDANGNVLSSISPSNLQTTYGYDRMDRLTGRTDLGTPQKRLLLRCGQRPHGAGGFRESVPHSISYGPESVEPTFETALRRTREFTSP